MNHIYQLTSPVVLADHTSYVKRRKTQIKLALHSCHARRSLLEEYGSVS